MVELMYNGDLLGVFSSHEIAKKWVENKYGEVSFSTYPLGTFLATDTSIKE